MAAKKKFVPRKRKILWIFPIIPFLLILLFTFLPSETEFFLGARSFKPKSTTALPADIQKAIAVEAIKELTQGYDYKHPDVAAQVDPGDLQIAQSPILAINPLYFLIIFGYFFLFFLKNIKDYRPKFVTGQFVNHRGQLLPLHPDVFNHN